MITVAIIRGVVILISIVLALVFGIRLILCIKNKKILKNKTFEIAVVFFCVGILVFFFGMNNRVSVKFDSEIGAEISKVNIDDNILAKLVHEDKGKVYDNSLDEYYTGRTYYGEDIEVCPTINIAEYSDNAAAKKEFAVLKKEYSDYYGRGHVRLNTTDNGTEYIVTDLKLGRWAILGFLPIGYSQQITFVSNNYVVDIACTCGQEDYLFLIIPAKPDEDFLKESIIRSINERLL